MGNLWFFAPIMRLYPNTSITLRFIGMLLTAPLVAFASPEVSLDSITLDSSPYFEVAGTDRVSVHLVGQLGRESARVCAAHMDLLPPSFPQKVTVLLSQNPANNSTDHYSNLTIEEGGFVTLRILWNANTDLRAVCHAMTEALLLRAVYYRYGMSSVDNLSAWVIAGLGESLFLRLRPSLLEYFDQDILQLDSSTVKEVLNASRSSGCDSIAAFSLVKAVDFLVSNHKKAAQILESALIGNFDEKELIALQGDNYEGVANAEWWKVGVVSLSERYQGAVDSMEASRLWMEGMADMSQFIDASSKQSPGNLRELGKYGTNEHLREMVAERRTAVLGGLLRVNPLYFNAAQSLGRFYEQIIYGDPGFHRTRTLIDYLNDLNAAIRMQMLAEDAISKTNLGE